MLILLQKNGHNGRGGTTGGWLADIAGEICGRLNYSNYNYNYNHKIIKKRGIALMQSRSDIKIKGAIGGWPARVKSSTDGRAGN